MRLLRPAGRYTLQATEQQVLLRLQANREALQVSAAPGKAPCLQLPPEPQLPDEQEALGPLALPAGLLQLLADACSKPQLADPEGARPALLASKGRLLMEVVEALTGKVVAGRVSCFPSRLPEHLAGTCLLMHCVG